MNVRELKEYLQDYDDRDEDEDEVYVIAEAINNTALKLEPYSIETALSGVLLEGDIREGFPFRDL